MIAINNNYGNIIEVSDRAESAKSDLLSRMYYARELPTMGGREVWLDLLDMYFMGEWDRMIETISSFNGAGGRTRAACIRDLNIIKEAE